MPLVPFPILPATSCRAVTRWGTDETNRRMEIMTAAMKKNADIDMEVFLNKLNPLRKTPGRKLFGKLYN